MERLLKTTRNWRQGHGSALMMTMITFLAIIAIASFAVDYAHVTLARFQLRTAIDAAGLAGASGLQVSPAEARLRAKTIAAANGVDGHALTLLDSDIEIGTFNNGTFTLLTGTNETKGTAVRITGQLSVARNSSVNLMFAKLLGRSFIELNAQSVGGSAAGADVVLVQDITSSFSTSLNNAKTGDQGLLDGLNTAGGKAGFGLVAHTGKGQTISPLKNVKNNYAALTSSITSLKLCGNTGMPACSGTDIAAGLEQGIAVFNDPAWTTKSPTGKVMILVSDGEPTQNSAGAHPTLTAAQLKTLAQTDCNTAWSQKIHVYVVFFNATNDSAAAAFMATLPRGNGDLVTVTDPTKIPDALAEITKKLPIQIQK